MLIYLCEQVWLSYCLMLVFMTYNTWLCLSVSLGAAVGWEIGHWFRFSSLSNVLSSQIFPVWLEEDGSDERWWRTLSLILEVFIKKSSQICMQLKKWYCLHITSIYAERALLVLLFFSPCLSQEHNSELLLGNHFLLQWRSQIFLFISSKS